ncbi:phage repressor protein CI [Hafnia alvei]|jgi:hypothetical protein|uniref:phage repressor protein CI n=1 Tax=Hafnia alvei TaxID=569 RepID=UPI000B653350|nr:phage repressor protein CI [Hafnia alvei]MBI0275299.1 phage repressor protein CI [Hafnia alvei]PNK98698.1 Cro/Cl family transcriptional regulator [Hafnia alvei]
MKFQGGESAVQRLMQAYGFTMKKQLGDHLGAGTGTISTWVKRNYFPGEAIVRCALETGASLEWLATGENGYDYGVKAFSPVKKNILSVPKKSLKKGILEDCGSYYLDLDSIDRTVTDPILIVKDEISWLFDKKIEQVIDGTWLLKKGDVVEVSEVKILPREELLIKDIVWPKDDISILGMLIFTQINET